MRPQKIKLIIILLLLPLVLTMCHKDIKEIERPEKVVSKRQVVYDIDTYSSLANLWEKYYNEFPSEDAYANWVYAARYAQVSNYNSLLEEGGWLIMDNLSFN